MENLQSENWLIDEFFEDWGPAGKPASTEARRCIVLEWLRDKVRRYEFVTLGLIAKLDPVLKDLQAVLPQYEMNRFFYRIDAEHITKTPESIIDKMLRDPARLAAKRPRICFNNFLDEMEDLGRFRIVTNFLSDTDKIAKALNITYGAARDELTPNQRFLCDEWQLKGNCLEDRIHLLPDVRKKGERCFKGCLYPRQKPTYKVEVQIMTVLAEAWDKKDHFLIYEPRRRGSTIRPQDQIEIFAHSEMLYLADLFFDHLKTRRSREGGES